MTTSASPAAEPRPTSLGAHEVPPERLALIRPHVAMLVETARSTGDGLPLEADVSDIIHVLEAEAR